MAKLSDLYCRLIRKPAGSKKIVTRLSSREFNQDVSRAKRAAEDGPVIITDRGKPAYVLFRHDDYRRLAEREPTIRDLLDQPGVEDIDFNPPRFGTRIFRPVDLS
jgi:prevent-host-death family protein